MLYREPSPGHDIPWSLIVTEFPNEKLSLKRVNAIIPHGLAKANGFKALPVIEVVTCISLL